MILPIASFAVSAIFTSIALHHTNRLWFLPPIIVPACLSLTTAHLLGDFGDLWNMGLAIYLVHNTSVIFFEKNLVLPRTTNSNRRYDFAAAWKIWSNPQLLGTSRQPPGAHRVDGHPPTLMRFTVVRILRIILHLTLLHLSASSVFPGPFLPLTPDDFSPTKQVYFRRLIASSLLPNDHNNTVSLITPRETALRAISAIYWILTSYLTLTAAHDILALTTTTLLRIDSTTDWPPLFGPISEAYTLRRFWGVFWHRLVYRPYTNYAGWVARRALGLRAGSRAEQLCMLFLVFMLSGSLHALVNWVLLGVRGEREVLWFCGNFAAGGLERWVIGQVKVVLKERGVRINGWVGRVGKGVGFAWVFLFFFWSMPKREYPSVYAVYEQAS